MRRRALSLTCLGLVLASLVAPGAGAAPARFTLEPGTRLLWNGPFVENSEGGDCDGAPCWTYRLDVTETSYRLRIGIDHPEVGDVFDVAITDPDGSRTTFSPGGGIYSMERAFLDPAPGTWKVEVTATDVTDSPFRMRAKLERKPPPLGVKRGPVLPNLQVLPPHEASFLLPVTNGSADLPPTGLDTGGAPGCHPEEHAEDGAVRCLRFAYGVRNTGRGPLDLQVGPETGVPLERELIQLVHRASGSVSTRSAGIARYHKTHGHYHHDAAIGLQLFRVTDEKKGELQPAGEPRTKGFAHREELLREWERFYPTWTTQGFGLGPGWADIYEWDRPGNYIDFGLNTDGRYVLRMAADPVDGVIESNELDNRGYTYMEIAGDQIEILETGRGRDPWDPCKILVGEGGHPDPPQARRPDRCPPDST